MADYHVGCGIAGIYAGTIKKNGIEWQNKSCVTDEAIEAVRDWFVSNINERTGSYGFSWKFKDGRTVKLIAKIDEGEQEGER